MKKISSKLFVALSGIMALGVSVPAVAQTANGGGSITIVRPLTVTKDTDIKFGTIIRPTSGAGSVTVPAAAGTGRTMDGIGVAALGTGGDASAAKFTLDGEGAQTVSVSVPDNFEMASGANKLTVETSKDIGGTVTLSSTLGSAGTKVFYIGGTVDIADDTVPGAYSGSFTVSANYN